MSDKPRIDRSTNPSLGDAPTVTRTDSVRDEGRREARAANPPPLTAGRHRIEGELGRGGMAVVWRAFDPELERALAIKVLLDTRDADTQRFLAEARITAQLQHPGVPPVHEIGRLASRQPDLLIDRLGELGPGDRLACHATLRYPAGGRKS